MGQHARTGLARVIADELEADWDRINVVQTEGEAKYGDQNTDGSTTIRMDFMRLRRIGASARAMLERAAAEKWEVPQDECKAIQHFVYHEATGRKIAFGDLAVAASSFDAPAYEGDTIEKTGKVAYRLKEPKEWRFIGKKSSTIDMDDLLQGKAVYGQDVVLPGMKIAVIARSPVYAGTIKSFDASAAMGISGVEKVIELPASNRKAPQNVGGFNPLGGIAIIATNTWAAIEGRSALKVEWEDGAHSDYTSATYRDELMESVTKPQKVIRNKGDIEAAFTGAAQVISADYYVPHIAHAQMEPPAALAQYKDGKVEVWTSTQNPQQARLDLAGILGLDYSEVRINNAFLGGAFGRKSKPDFVYEAALLSRELGEPVKVIWTREDDLQHDFFHAVSAQRLEASFDAQGRVTGWRQRVSFPSIGSTFNPATEHGSSGEMGLGFIDNPLGIANMRLENGKAKGKIRIGWLRSVNNIQHAFATQSFIAELAHKSGRDPKDYLLELIGPDRVLDPDQEGMTGYINYGQSFEDYPIDTGRLKNVINTAANGLGWRSQLAMFDEGAGARGRGIGIAGHRSFSSYVATAVEVVIDGEGNLSIPNVHVACDCGIAVNPESVIAQMEGASIFALSNILMSAITVTNGRVDQSNFHDYEMARMDHAPRSVNVTLIESNNPPGGAGEPGTPPFAPALTNAIFAATGKRIRDLPIANQLRV